MTQTWHKRAAERIIAILCSEPWSITAEQRDRIGAILAELDDADELREAVRFFLENRHPRHTDPRCENMASNRWSEDGVSGCCSLCRLLKALEVEG